MNEGRRESSNQAVERLLKRVGTDQKLSWDDPWLPGVILLFDRIIDRIDEVDRRLQRHLSNRWDHITEDPKEPMP
jgi:hypothetical protein